MSHKNYPNLPIKKAIRMSSAIPYYFIPIKYNDKLFIDGGTIDNYPIHLFNNNLDECIGIYLQENVEYMDINNIEDFTRGIFNCFNNGLCTKSIIGYEKYSIVTNISQNINIINFEIHIDDKLNMFNHGYNITHEYFKNFI